MKEWSPKIKDIVVFSIEGNVSPNIYRINRIWHDNAGTVEICRLQESELCKGLMLSFTNPVLKNISSELYDIVDSFIKRAVPLFEWATEEIPGSLIITTLDHLKPAGKTYLELMN